MTIRTFATKGHETISVGLASDTKPVEGLTPGDYFIELDGTTYRWTGPFNERGSLSDWAEIGAPVSLVSRGAGERSEDSETGDDYMSIAGEWHTKVASYDGDLAARTIYPGPCLVAGIDVLTALSAHESTLTDAAVVRKTLIVSIAVGPRPFPGPIAFFDECVWTPGSLSAGRLEFYYKPMDPRVESPV